MKVYYDKLSKEEKKNTKIEFINDENYKIYKKSNTIVIFCIFGLIVSIVSVIFDFIYKTGILNYVIDGLLFVFSLIVLFRMQSIKKRLLNNYALQKDNRK